MKSFLIAVTATGVIGGIFWLSAAQNGPVSYVAPKPEITATSKPELPVWASDEDAVVAAQEVIRRKDLQAELEALGVEKLDLDTEYETASQALEDRIEDIERELGTF